MSTGLTIRLAEPSAADYATYVGLYELADAEQPLFVEQCSVDDLHAFDRACERSGATSRRYLAADSSGATVGIAHLFPVTWLPEPGTYWIVARVRGDLQGHGIGTALIRHMQDDLAALGARAMWLLVPEDAGGLLAALERRGFRERMRSHPYTLAVAAAPPANLGPRLERLAAQGLRVSTLAECRDDDPGWLDHSYALHATLTREVPLPEKIFTAREEFAAFAVESPDALLDAFFVVREGPRYVGLSFLQRHADTPDTLHQELTGTLPAYRGLGLARTLKLLTIDYARRHGYRQIVTWIEDTNGGMVTINRSYGFERQPGLVLLERPVTVARPQPARPAASPRPGA